MILGLDYDLECLGRRIDAARNSLILAKKSQSSWAQRHWDETYRYLLRKWSLMSSGERKIWESIEIKRNWLTVDTTSEVMSVLDKQIDAVFERFRMQEFSVDLESVAKIQQALSTK